MTGKIMPLRERDTSTVQAAADAFLSSPRYANPNTRRSYAGVLDRLLAQLGASRPLAEVSGEELASLLEQLWGQRAPATWNRNRGAITAWLSWCAASRHHPDRPDARTAPGRMPPGGRSSFEVRRLRDGRVVAKRKAAASQTFPVRWPISRPLDARTGRSVPLVHDEPGIDRQRVFGGLREKRVTLLVRCLISGIAGPGSRHRHRAQALPGPARAGWTPMVKNAGKRCAGEPHARTV